MHANEKFFEYLAFGTGDIANLKKKKCIINFDG